MELLGKHIRQMDVLGDIDGEEYEEVRVCRLAMLTHGEDPANEARVQELLDLPLADYQDYVGDVLAQMRAGAAPVWQHSGDYHVPLASGDTAVVRPLKGRHRRLLGRLDDAHGDRAAHAHHVQPGQRRPGRCAHRRLPVGDDRRGFFIPAGVRRVEADDFARDRVILAQRGILSWTESGDLDLVEFYEVVAEANRLLRRRN